MPYVAFLAAYPYAAWVFDGRNRPGRNDYPLHPVYGNPPYLRLIHGPGSSVIATPAVPSNTVFLGGLVDALADVNEAKRLQAWIQTPKDVQEPSFNSTTQPDHTIILSFRPSWLPPREPPFRLEVTKTYMDGFWVCTTVPDAPSRAPSPSPSIHSRRSVNNPGLRLANFPPPTNFPRLLSSGQSVIENRDPVMYPPTNPGTPCDSGGDSKRLSTSPTSLSETTARSGVLRSTPTPEPLQILDPVRHISAPKYPGEMEKMVKNFPWETTDVGSRANWSQALYTALSICLRSPTPCALFWGPTLVLLYNDKYADMAGKKHPRIFGKCGNEAWGDMWDRFGPLTSLILKGESAAREDDLMFFNRLTSADLPEEVYQTWTWIPVKGENGAIEGIISWSIETTQKVIAERRLLTLRTFSERAKLSKDVLQLTSALLSVLDQNKQDVPFAAFYYCQTPNLIPRYHSDNENIEGECKPPVDLTLKLAGSIGVPDAHHATPLFIEIPYEDITSHPNIDNRTEVADDDDSEDDNPSNQGASDDGTPEPSTNSTSAGESMHVFPSSSNPSSSNGVIRNCIHGSEKVSPSDESPSSDHPSTPWTWPIADSIASRRPLLVPSLPPEVVQGLSRRSWGDAPRQAVVIPIWSFEGTAADAMLPQAVLIMGLNPRRPYDKDYEEWMDLFRSGLAVSLAAALSWEAETQRAEQLAQLDAAKTSFFSNVSHELRTPLTLIMGPVQDAIRTAQDEKQKDTLKLALRNVSRLSRLVDSLMDFTRIEAGKLLGNFKPAQLGSFTADLATLFRSIIEKSHVEFIIDCDIKSQVLCYVDPDLWEKIVFNLIGNAFKYTISGSIAVRLRFEPRQVRFMVEDTGVGIPKDDIPKVFHRFHRVASVSRSHEGTGIGLSLTKELVRLHGGTIMVDSATEAESGDGSHGSTFTVLLPLGKDHLPSAHVVDSMSEEHRHQHYARGIVEEAALWSRHTDGSAKTPSDSSESGSNEHKVDTSTMFFMKRDIILLVDDNADMRAFIKSIFKSLCAVAEATSGEDALRLCDQGMRPTVILSDVMMPGMDGYTFMKRLRERKDTKLLPVIFLTAKAGEDARVDGLLSGADDYIAKPFQARELIARVHLQMQLGKRRAELEARFDERQREIQILSDHSPIGIVRTNSDGIIIYSNPRWFELTSRAGLPLDTWVESVHPDHREAVAALWHKAIEERHGGSLEFQWSNGIWTKGQAVPLGRERNSTGGVLLTLTDISDQRLYEASQLMHAQEREATARRRAEDAEERRREADERRRAQELLIDVTSHELRQPVSAILNCSALVKANLANIRDDLGEAHKNSQPFKLNDELLALIDEDLEALDSIYQCGLAQERIANDVLSLSRIQLQVLSIHPVQFDIAAEIKQVVAIFHNELKMKRIKLNLTFEESLWKLNIRQIRSDKSRLGQVLTNLLSNAIKFADTSVDKREIQVNVAVSFKQPQDNSCLPPLEDEIPENPSSPMYLYVAVKDSGPGLKPDDLHLLFRRFQQGSNSHDVFGGSGLGLFVSRKLCDLMDGRIDVDSVYGQGATFRFYIQAFNCPVEPDPEGTVGNVTYDISDSKISLPSTNQTIILPTNMLSSRSHVLITEDNLINQTVLNRQLKGAGFLTSLASNGQQALEHIHALAKQQQMFDVILMDCEMPVMDGLTAVREIRRMEASGEIPGRNRVFALTGNARAGQVKSAREAGMDDVLIKPYKIDHLLHRLRESRQL